MGSLLEQRFWEKVNKNGPTPGHVHGLGQCWIWSGDSDKHGYGRVFLSGKRVSAHRLSWVFAHGTIPGALFVLHKCDNPSCVRPDHLWLGTPGDNMRDAAKKGRLRVPHPTGEAHHNAKLTAANVAAIRSSLTGAYGEYRKLSVMYGVTHQTISDIATGKKWKEAAPAIRSYFDVEGSDGA